MIVACAAFINYMRRMSRAGVRGAANSSGLGSLVETPASRYTIRAVDDAGPFTLTLERGQAIAMTIKGAAVDRRLLQQSGNHLRVSDVHGDVMLDLTLTVKGGITWASRPKQAAASR